MRTIRVSILVLAAAAAALAQQWEIGGTAGAGFLPGVAVTNPLGAATTGFQSGPSFGAFFGQNLYTRFSGEVHYSYMQSNLKLSSGGQTATFSGQAHVLHYDILFHANRRRARAQAYAIVGGGMKVFRGTGTEAAYQPLSQYGYFTKTQAVKPMGDVGVGVKFQIAPHLFMRTEIRDYITPFPEQIITPAPKSKFGSILHDIVPSVGISYMY